MNDELWLGTESALMALINYERDAQAHFVDMMDRRKAFIDEQGQGEVAPRKGAYLLEVSGSTALIKVSGSLTKGYRWYHEFADGQVTSYEAIADALDLAADHPDVANIVLSIHSGGGAVTGIDALGLHIRRVDQIKPVRAYTETAAFSAAYWIASSAREIIAGSRMAEVGSIGTLMVHTSMAKMAAQAGVEFTVFRAGKYKALGLPYEELTDEVKAHMQADLEKANGFFLEHVSLRRSLMMSEKSRWAEGRTFFAGDAIDVGLIDRVASLDEIVSAAGAYQPRRDRMFISEEKRAQIAAGAPAKDVLTAEELTQYEAEVAAAAEEPTDKLAAAEEPTDKLAAEEDVASTTPTSDLTDYYQALKDNGRLEARLDAEKERREAAEQKLSAQASQLDSLTEIGALAVKNLQVALGMTQSVPTTPEGLVTEYNGLQTRMAQRFKVGRQSASEASAPDHKEGADIPLAFRSTKAGNH
jgi:signal peptide peptidase SppA